METPDLMPHTFDRDRRIAVDPIRTTPRIHPDARLDRPVSVNTNEQQPIVGFTVELLMLLMKLKRKICTLDRTLYTGLEEYAWNSRFASALCF
jgi:hypothetical protein